MGNENVPLVSVICLCYNHSQYVEEALDSVKQQSYLNVELIIVDDCSSDDSRMVIEKWVKKNNCGVFIGNPENLGVSRSFNLGLDKVAGVYIVDLAADDILMPDFIEKHLTNFEQYDTLDNVGVSFSNVELITSDAKHMDYHHPVDSMNKAVVRPFEGDVYAAILKKFYFNPTGLMVKKVVYDSLGGYDETLLFEDVDFWIRSSREYNYRYTDYILVKKRMLADSLTNQMFAHFLRIRPKQRKLEKNYYQICKKAFLLNTSELEDNALISRVKFYYWRLFKSLNVKILLCFVYLHIKILRRIYLQGY